MSNVQAPWRPTWAGICLGLGVGTCPATTQAQPGLSPSDLLSADVGMIVELFTPMCSAWDLPGMAGDVPCWPGHAVPNPLAIAWPEFGPEGDVVRLWHVEGRVVAVWSDHPSGPATTLPAGGLPAGAVYVRTRQVGLACGNGPVGGPPPPLGPVVLVGRRDGARLELAGAAGSGVIYLDLIPPEVVISIGGDPVPLARLRAGEVVVERQHRLDVALDLE